MIAVSLVVDNALKLGLQLSQLVFLGFLHVEREPRNGTRVANLGIIR
jgi:hypothetical protein